MRFAAKLILLLAHSCWLASAISQDEKVPIAEVKRDKPVDFAAELIPIFRRSCLPCHNAADAKADLIMETPSQILKGGESGKVVIPGKGAESLLVQAAAHTVKPFMPPKSNKANAPPLSSEELGLVKLWIDQGATGAVATLPPIQWKEFPASFNAIGAAAISPDGQWIACARGNRVDLYETARMEWAGELIDSEIGAADRDLIASLAFSFDGRTIAAGGYRAIKLWSLQDPPLKKLEPVTNLTIAIGELSLVATENVLKLQGADGNEIRKFELGSPVKALAFSAEKKRVASAGGNLVKLWNFDDSKLIAEFKGDRRLQEAAATAQRSLNFVKSEVAYRKSSLEAAEKHLAAETEALKKYTEARNAAEKAHAEKIEAQKKAGETKAAADKTLTDLKASIAQAAGNKNLSAKLNESAAAGLKSSTEAAASAARIFDRAKANRDSAYDAIIELSAAAKAAPEKKPEALAAIDRALVSKLSFEHAESAKAAADKALVDAQGASKSAAENQGKAEKLFADLQAQEKSAEEKLSATVKQLAEADQALKVAENARTLANTNFESGSAVAKKAADSAAEAKTAFAAAQDSEKKATEVLDSANKKSAESESEVTALAFSGSWLSATIANNSIRFYSAQSGAAGPVRDLAGAGSAPAVLDGPPAWTLQRRIGDGSEKSPLADRVLTLDFSTDGGRLASGGGVPTRPGEIKIWNLTDGALIHEIKDPHSDSVNCVRFSPDGKFLASGAADKLMKVFEVETGKFVRSFEGHTHHVLNVAWMRHGRTLASAGADSVIKLWDFASGEQKRTIGGSSREITALAFLDGLAEALVASGDNQVRIVREDGGNVRGFGGATGYTQAAAITPDARFVIAGGVDSILRLWNGQNGQLLKTFPPPERKIPALAENKTN